MTWPAFLAACGAATIDPALALENDEIKEALAANDDNRVRALILSEF